MLAFRLEILGGYEVGVPCKLHGARSGHTQSGCEMMDCDFLKHAILASERALAVSHPPSLWLPPVLRRILWVSLSSPLLPRSPRPAPPPPPRFSSQLFGSQNLSLCLTVFCSISCSHHFQPHLPLRPSSHLPVSLGGQGLAVDPEKRPPDASPVMGGPTLCSVQRRFLSRRCGFRAAVRLHQVVLTL